MKYFKDNNLLGIETYNNDEENFFKNVYDIKIIVAFLKFFFVYCFVIETYIFVDKFFFFFCRFSYFFEFLQPASLYGYHLVALHGSIMYYVGIILVFVYWCLYKILKEYSWNNFNKQRGFLRFPYRLKYYLWLDYCFTIIGLFYCSFFFFIVDRLKYIFYKLTFRPIVEPTFVSYYLHVFDIFEEDFSLSDFFIDGYISYYLFNYSTEARFHNSNKDNTLKTLSWNHSICMEYIFAFFPTIIISLILIPSFYLLYSMDEEIDPQYTIKVIGNQWYWAYESNFLAESNSNYFVLKGSENSFDSTLVEEDKLMVGDKRLFEVDKGLPVPTNVTVRFIISAADVLHSWAIPQLGLKVDGIPGRLNQFISIITHPGIFFGQCSELCGVGHGFMPIRINAIPHDLWLNLVFDITSRGNIDDLLNRGGIVTDDTLNKFDNKTPQDLSSSLLDYHIFDSTRKIPSSRVKLTAEIETYAKLGRHDLKAHYLTVFYVEHCAFSSSKEVTIGTNNYCNINNIFNINDRKEDVILQMRKRIEAVKELDKYLKNIYNDSNNPFKIGHPIRSFRFIEPTNSRPSDSIKFNESDLPIEKLLKSLRLDGGFKSGTRLIKVELLEDAAFKEKMNNMLDCHPPINKLMMEKIEKLELSDEAKKWLVRELAIIGLSGIYDFEWFWNVSRLDILEGIGRLIDVSEDKIL